MPIILSPTNLLHGPVVRIKGGKWKPWALPVFVGITPPPPMIYILTSAGKVYGSSGTLGNSSNILWNFTPRQFWQVWRESRSLASKHLAYLHYKEEMPFGSVSPAWFWAQFLSYSPHPRFSYRQADGSIWSLQKFNDVSQHSHLSMFLFPPTSIK